jgi:hypothetical protein
MNGRSQPAVLVRTEDGALALRAGPGVTVRAATRLLSAPRPGKDMLGRAVRGALRRAGQQSTVNRGEARAAWEGEREEQPEVIDATAGLGADAFHLAALGLEVTMVERVPEIAALLADALERAATGSLGERAREAAARLELERADARSVLEQRMSAGAPPAVVYLDPMYPRQTKSALPGKGMALFRELVGDDADAAALLMLARQAAANRVVVKRPLKAPWLGGQEPTGSLVGNTTRYDLYAPIMSPRPPE